MALDKIKDAFIVGYGGWVKINRYPSVANYNFKDPFCSDVIGSNAKMVQVTNASFSRQTNFPTAMSYYLPHNDEDNTARSQILMGEGTYTFTGDISFELTYAAMKKLFYQDFFERGSLFSLYMYDGQYKCSVTNCVWSSISIQCSAQGLVTMSISYQSNNSYMNKMQIRNGASMASVSIYDTDETEYSNIPIYDFEDGEDDEWWDGYRYIDQSNVILADETNIMYDDKDFLLPYWECGHDKFMEFTITFERNVTPVFLNGDMKVASYLRPGMVNVSLNAVSLECFDNWNDKINIRIGRNQTGTSLDSWCGIILNKVMLQSFQYNMSSMNDSGAKSYTWNSISCNPKDKLFEIYPERDASIIYK